VVRRSIWLRSIALGVAYALVARLGLAMDAVGGLATLVWPPSGLALAALLLGGVRLWPGVAVGALVANLWVGAAPLLALGIALGNTLEAVAGAALLARARHFRPSLDDLASVLRLVVFAALGSTLVSASIGSAAMVLAGVVPLTRVVPTFQAWWIGDVIGDLVVAPVLLTFRVPDTARSEGGTRERLLLAVLLAVGIFLAFGPTQTTLAAAFRAPHVLMPLLAWAAVRFGPRGAAAATFVASIGAVLGTALGYGSFVRGTLHDGLLELQSFMAVVATTFLILAAVTAERQRLLERERLAREGAERAVERREEFLAVVSHELRTPLTPLELQLEALLRAVPPGEPALRQRIERAKRQSSRLVRLVEDLLDSSRLAGGRLDLFPEDFDCAKLALESLDQAGDEAARAGSTLSLRVEGPTDGRWDRQRVGQALANLLSNAIKYGSGGPIELALCGSAQFLDISCTDRGIGIEARSLSIIFERFERAAPLRNHGGLGLGLYVAREIARAHHGDILVESTPGAGSTFTLRLPRVPVVAPREP
jgi:signal transduction histidine kinase